MIKEDRINEIIKENGKSIIVLKGFDTNKLSKKHKYFSFSIDFYDKINLKKLNEQVIEETFKNRTFDDTFKWMTIEEYLLFKNTYICTRK